MWISHIRKNRLPLEDPDYLNHRLDVPTVKEYLIAIRIHERHRRGTGKSETEWQRWAGVRSFAKNVRDIFPKQCERPIKADNYKAKDEACVYVCPKPHR